MEDFSKYVRGFSISAVGVIYTAVMYYAGALISVNLLGPTQYGLFSLAFMVPSVVIPFLLFGLDITATRYIAHSLGKNNEEKALQCSQTIFLVRICVAILSMIIFFAAARPLAHLFGEDITLGFQLLSAYICVFMLGTYFLAVLQGYFLIKERTLVDMLGNTLFLIFLVPFVLYGLGYIAPVLAFLIAFSLAFVFSIYFLEKNHKPVIRLKFEGIKALKDYLKFSFFVYLSNSFHMVYVWAGTIVIKLYSMPVETVGYYRAMFSITNTVLLISYGLTIVLYPMLSELNAKKDYDRLAFGLRTVIKYALALSIPAAFGVLFVSQPLVSVLFPEYTPAVPLLRIFSLRMVFLPLRYVMGAALIALGFEKKQAFISIFLCGFSFVLSLGLGLISVEGIAFASTLGLALSVVLQYWVLKKNVTGIPGAPVVKFCCSAGIMCGVVWLVLQTPAGDVVKLGLSFICGALVYTFFVLRTGGIAQQDLEMMRSGISAFGRIGKVLEPVLNLAQKIGKG
jgi:O-antigen/teichoic acid export membrane protein